MTFLISNGLASASANGPFWARMATTWKDITTILVLLLVRCHFVGLAILSVSVLSAILAFLLATGGDFLLAWPMAISCSLGLWPLLYHALGGHSPGNIAVGYTKDSFGSPPSRGSTASHIPSRVALRCRP